MTSEICELSAVELARLIRAKRLSARDVVGAHLTQIERVNPSVNAIVTLVADQAMERARLADEELAHGRPVGPLHGLPIAHKDLQPTKGIRTTFGSPIYKDFVPDEDSLIVERLRGAGAIVVGKTNTPEFGAGSQTFNPVFGSTLNPYDQSRTCGGSSGGAAVALATRHAADRRRQRHGRLAAQPGRASAASSACGRRPAACRPGRRPPRGRRSASTVRWRAASPT